MSGKSLKGRPLSAAHLEAAIRDALYLLNVHLPPSLWGLVVEGEPDERDDLRQLVWMSLTNLVYSDPLDWGGLPLLGKENLTDPDARRCWLIERALSGSHLVHDALCHVAERLTLDNKPLPLWLQRYVVRTAREGPARLKRGEKLADKSKSRRDQAITLVALVIAVRYRLRPKRNDESNIGYNDESNIVSACSILAAAFQRMNVSRMGEANLNRIWSDGDGPTLLTQEEAFSNTLGPNLWILGAPMGRTWYAVYEGLRQAAAAFEASVRGPADGFPADAFVESVRGPAD